MDSMGQSLLQHAWFWRIFGPTQEQYKIISVIKSYILVSIPINDVLNLLFSV